MIKEDVAITKEEVIEKTKKSLLQKELNFKEVLAVLGICGVIGGYGYSFVYPEYKEYKVVKDNLNSINAEITEYEGRISQMPVLEDKLFDLQTEAREKGKILAHNMEDGMFIIGLSKVMSDADVDLVSYDLDEIVPYDNFYAIPTSLTVRGNYRRVREVMYYLEEQKNMTQILDYTMETHMVEDKDTSNNTNTNASTTRVPDSTVYWTSAGSAYHKDTCMVLEEEIKANEEKMILSGAASVSNRTSACEVCKPYIISQVSQQQTETQKPKADGTIEATFKFIMYSGENPKLELENDDSSKWKPGKYNPFTTTSR